MYTNERTTAASDLLKRRPKTKPRFSNMLEIMLMSLNCFYPFTSFGLVLVLVLSHMMLAPYNLRTLVAARRRALKHQPSTHVDARVWTGPCSKHRAWRHHRVTVIDVRTCCTASFNLSILCQLTWNFKAKETFYRPFNTIYGKIWPKFRKTLLFNWLRFNVQGESKKRSP